jgi:hypothetical protein
VGRGAVDGFLDQLAGVPIGELGFGDREFHVR